MIARTRTVFSGFSLALAILAADPAISFSATITIVNQDGAGEGFNDPTPAAPVGGNPGTTIGQQRLLVFQQAAGIWGALLPSNVTIFVQAQFNALTCNSTSAVLGQAGTIQLVRDFPNAEYAGTWYHSALANKRANVDLLPGINDINAAFNSSLGQAGCLTGTFWYYGFDHDEGNNIDLLAVVLHELGHGLGFSAFANLSTGQQAGGFPGIYERFLLDHSFGLHWNQMSDGQRASSAVNTGNLVWDGVATTVKAPSFLDPRPQVVVSSPPVVAGTYTSGSPSFGATLTPSGVSGQVVLADDGTTTTSDACEALINAGAVAGKIAIVDRGTCAFTIKAQNVQNAGAIGMIMVNNVAGLAPDIGGTNGAIVIPITSVSQTVGNALKANLGGGVNATLRVENSKLAGADDHNHVLMYAPNPVQGGSSVSHWDVSATPNLLMEPSINSDLTGVDLTLYAFEDIGWLPHTTGVPAPVPAAGLRVSRATPNPSSGTTRVSFTLPRPMSARVDVLDLSGRLVKNLATYPLAVGDTSLVWDGADASGRRMAPGLYLIRVRAGGEEKSSRVALIR